MAVFRLILFFILILLPDKTVIAQRASADSSIHTDIGFETKNKTTNSSVINNEPALLRTHIHRYPPYYTYILIFALIIVAIIRIVAPSYIRQLFSSILSPSQLYALYQEGKFGFNFTNLLFDITCLAIKSVNDQIAN